MRINNIAIAVLLLSLTSCMQGKKPIVIGHRGAMGHETENTLASVQKAMDLGVDMIEIDVFKIESGEIVVFHDDTVDRLANGGGKIEEYNISDLRKLILDGNHRIPMLQDVLKLIDHKVKLNIELKGLNTADRVNFITNYYIQEKGWKLEDFLISSFNWDELRDMRKLNENIPIAVLTEEDPMDAIPVGKELNAEAINLDYSTLTNENNSAIKNAGFKINAWTVNNAEDIIAMKRFGVHGIITNYPERVN